MIGLLTLGCTREQVPLERPREDTTGQVSEAALPNVLLILLDDIGTEQLAIYGVWPEQPSTPTIDTLAASGVLFRNAYANAECSPTRAAVMTGRYGRRTGIGRVVDLGDTFRLEPDVNALPALLARQGYATSHLGKWHLAAGPDAPMHPGVMGWEWFAGSLENLGTSLQRIDNLGWYRWEKNVGGTLQISDTYATTDTTDDAISRIAAMPEPWLTWVAYNSAHAPLEAPPDALLAQPLPVHAEPRIVYHAMIEALDHEIGRLLGSMEAAVRARTVVVLMGDNGSPAGMAGPLFTPGRTKNTVYEGGVHVPLIVAGPGAVPGSETAALVHAVDVFATVADLAGVAPGSTPDGESFQPFLAAPLASGGRPLVWSEILELFDLDNGGPDEGPDLVAAGLTSEQSLALIRLQDALDAEIARIESVR